MFVNCETNQVISMKAVLTIFYLLYFPSSFIHSLFLSFCAFIVLCFSFLFFLIYKKNKKRNILLIIFIPSKVWCLFCISDDWICCMDSENSMHMRCLKITLYRFVSSIFNIGTALLVFLA